MGVKQRIALLVATTLIGLMLVAGVGIYQIDRAYTAANFSNTNTIPALNALNKLAISVDDARFRVMRHVFFAADQATMDKVAKTIADARDEARGALSAYEGLILDAEGKQLFE